MFNVITKKYRLSMRNWTKGTGRGPGAPEDYCHWESRDATEYFLGYGTKFGAGGLELTWIYMSGLALVLLLYSRFDGMISKEACLEDGIQPTCPSKRAAEYVMPPTNSSKKYKSLVRSMEKMSNDLSSTLGKLETLKNK